MSVHSGLREIESDASVETSTAPLAVRRGTGRPTARRWWLVAAGLVVVIVVTQAALWARERSRIALLQTLPGVLKPVDASFKEQWSLDGLGSLRFMASAAMVDGRLVGPNVSSNGTQTIQAIDPATGATAWSTTVAGPDPALVDPSSADAPTCAVAQPDDPASTTASGATYVCLVLAGITPPSDTASLTLPATARIAVIDPVSGTLVANREVAPSSALAVDGGVAYIGQLTADGHGVVTATDPRTGAVRWTFTTSAPLLSASGEPLQVHLSALGGRVLVASSAGPAWLLSSDGEVQREIAEGGGATLVAPRTGMLAVQTTSGPRPAATLLETGGAGTVAPTSEPITGDLVSPTVDDGSSPGLVFTGGEYLTAWDAASGEERWSILDSSASNIVLLDGRLYQTTIVGLRALDASTGALLWQKRVALPSHYPTILSDGRSIVVLELAPVSHMVAFDPIDGSRMWADALPDVTNLAAVGGHLLASRFTFASAGTVALG